MLELIIGMVVGGIVVYVIGWLCFMWAFKDFMG